MDSAIQVLIKRFAFPHWRWYTVGLGFLLLSTWITVSVPRLSKTVVNDILGPHAYNSVLNLILFIIALGFSQILIRSISRLILFWPGRKIESELKNFYFHRFLELPLSFFQKHSQGDLISRLGNDVTQIRACFAFGFLQIVNLVFLFSFALYSMLRVSPNLTLATLAPLFFIIVVSRIGSPKIHKYTKLSQIKLGQLTQKLSESFVHVDILQSNNAIKSFSERVEEQSKEVYKARIMLAIIRTLIFPLSTLLTGVSYLMVLYVGGKAVMESHLTVGDILAFNIYISMLSFPLTALGIIIALVQRARSSSERLVYLEGFEKEKTKKSEKKITEKDFLHIQNLSFSFEKEAPPKLQNIELSLKEGEKLGITGPIGSCKSTLLSLITRLHEAPPGTIFHKGKDIVSIDPQKLRSKFGYCLQNSFFFSSSIRENLCLGLENKPSQKDLEEAARKAQILDDILNFQEQWDTKLGERGVRLSGGQKQRLDLARLLLHNPELLLLDDITSAVDTYTERHLLEELKQMNKTMILVSHRPSALKICDRVLLLKEGRVLDEGHFETLLQKHPKFFVELERDETKNH